MSDIVKEWSLDRVIERQLAKRKFVCNNCGCEFIATKHEYRYIWYKVGCYAPCPTCGMDAREREDWDWY